MIGFALGPRVEVVEPRSTSMEDRVEWLVSMVEDMLSQLHEVEEMLLIVVTLTSADIDLVDVHSDSKCFLICLPNNSRQTAESHASQRYGSSTLCVSTLLQRSSANLIIEA